MRTMIFGTFLVTFWAAACTDAGRSDSANTIPPQQNASGSHPNPGQQGQAFSISTEAYYQASLHSTSSPGRVISLSLTPKRRAEMTTDYLDIGEWTNLDNGNLLLNLRRVGANDSIKLEFKTDGDKLVYTGSDYGADGLILWVKPLPESK
jgi:hypothetical protein